IFVMSFVPVFGGNSGQFFDAEATGISEDMVRPRISVITANMALTYIALTIVGFFFLWAGPMDAFDAACHTLSAISTGGFSTKQASISYFDSAYTEYVITALMFFGGTNFMLLYTFFTRFRLRTFQEEEFRWYVSIILIFTLGISAMLLSSGKMNDVEYTFRMALFQVVAAVTTTGYATADYQMWGEVYWLLFLAMILFCGCEGSTSGGMKVSRLVVLTKNTLLVFKKQVHPNALYRVKMNGKVISDNTSSKILAFVFLYLSLAAFSAVVLSFTGMSFDESIGVSISSISSYGFGLGSYGPSGTYESASVFAKYYLCFLMLVGRLEVFTILSLFVPSFWKR
ncbi:MAG: potassium transporter TrkG, partial [Proteiniphilum sp.]